MTVSLSAAAMAVIPGAGSNGHRLYCPLSRMCSGSRVIVMTYRRHAVCAAAAAVAGVEAAMACTVSIAIARLFACACLYLYIYVCINIYIRTYIYIYIHFYENIAITHMSQGAKHELHIIIYDKMYASIYGGES